MRLFTSRSTLLGTVASVGWLGTAGLAATALSGSVGAAATQAAADGLPTVACAVAGLTLPLVLIWQWATGAERMRKLEQRLNMGPASGGKAVTDKEITALEEQMSRVATIYDNLEAKFTHQSHQLSALCGDLTTRVDEITRSLDDQAHRVTGGEQRIVGLTNSLGQVTDHANAVASQIADTLEKPMTLVSGRMENVAGNIRAHVEDLWTQLQNLESAYAATREMAESARSALHKEVGDIHHVSGLAGQELAALSASLRPQIDMIESMGRRAAERTGEMQQHIDAQAIALEQVGENLKAQGAGLTDAVREQASQLDGLKETVDSLGSTLSTQFRKQVETLIETSEMAGEQVIEQAEKGTRHLQDRLAEHSSKLELITGQVTESVDGVCEKLDSRMELMREGAVSLNKDLAEATERATADLNQELINIVATIESRVSLIEDKAAEINGAIAQAGQGLDSQLMLTRERIAEATSESFDELKSQTGLLIERMREALSDKSEAVGATISVHIEALTQASQDIEGVLADQQQGFAKDMEKRLAVTSANFAAKLAEVQKVTGDVDAQLAAATNGTIATIADKIDAVTAHISDRLTLVTDGAEDLQTKLDTSLSLIEARGEEVQTHLANNANGLAQQLGQKLGQSGAASLDEFEERTTGISEHLKQTLHLLEARSDELAERFDKDNGTLVRTMEESADAMLRAFLARLERARDASQTELGALAGSIDETADHFDKALSLRADKAVEKLSGAVDAMTDKLDSRSAQTFAQFEAGQVRIDGATAALSDKIAFASEEAFGRLSQLISATQSDITAVSDGALVNLVNIGRELPDIAERLGHSVDLAIDKANGLEGVYALRTDELTRLSGELIGFSDSIRTEIQQLPEQTESALHLIAAQSGSTRDILTSQHVEIEQAMGQSQAQVDGYRQALDAKLVEFNQLFEELQRYSHNIEAVVDEQVRSITNSTDHAKRAWLDARGAMEEQTAAANEIADSYIDRMAELSKRARLEVGELKEMSETAVQSVLAGTDAVSNQLSGFGATLGGLRELINAVGGAAERHSETISATADEAERRTTRLVEQLNDTQKERFLQSASDLVAQLNHLAVDVDQILEGELSEDVVRGFNEGDRGISVRRLLSKRKEPHTDLRIVDAYRRSPGFSNKVDSYLAMFEQLLSQAKSSDPTRMVHTAFLTGDLGKLYVFLTQSLGQSLGQPLSQTLGQNTQQSAKAINENRAA